MRAKTLTSDAMYILKCATGDYVLSKKSDPQNITSEELRKVIEPLQHCKDKAISKTLNYLLIQYCSWVHIENGSKIVIYVEKHNINARNLTYCSDIAILDNDTGSLITTDVKNVYSTDCSDDDVDGLIATDIDAGDQLIVLILQFQTMLQMD